MIVVERFTASRFAAAWSEVTHDASQSPRVFDALRAAYAEPRRAYHTAQHVDECLMHLDRVRAYAMRPAEIELALWFHDAIYDTHASHNEERSAEWASRELESVDAPAEIVDRIRALILVTRHDAIPSAPDEQLLVDADLSILGASRERFDEYEAQVRREYSWVPEFVFRRERGKILRAFLARPSIYSTPWFRDSLETRARANLASHAAR